MLFSNEKYTAEIDGLGAFVSLSSGGKQFVKERLPLFAFRLREKDEVSYITSDEAQKVEITKNDRAVSLRYDFQNISFIVNLSFDSRISAYFSFVNKTGKYVEWVDFLQIAVCSDLVKQGGSGKIVMDINEGVLYDDINLKEKDGIGKYKDIEYPSLGLHSLFPAVVESQFISYYDDTAGIYIATEDNERNLKGIDCRPFENAIKLQFRLFIGEDKNTENFTLPYNQVIDFFKGDWHCAAELYRNWFYDNLPEGLVAVKDNENLPEWYADSPLIVAYPLQGVHDMDPSGPNKLFPYNNALPFIDEIASSTNSRIMALLMHWEGTAPWAPPYVWPPLGGEKLLTDFADEIHKRNHLLGLYCSGISYSLHSNINDFNMEDEYNKKGLSKHMCASPTGEIVSNTCQQQRKSYDMCISEDFTKDVLLNEAEKMKSGKVDYIQILDQNHGGTPYLCYSDKHSHPAVPGKWMVEHMTDFLKKLKACLGEDILLGCESAAAEAYIPYLNLSDNRFNLNYSAAKPIPIYAYIYHKYLHNFSGNSVCSTYFFDVDKSPNFHMLRLAYSFIIGDLLTVVINEDGEIIWAWGQRDFSTLPDRAPIMEFIKNATEMRRGVGKEFLVFGEMTAPLPVKCEEEGMFKLKTGDYEYYPAVLTSAWLNSKGEKAQILATYTSKEETCEIDLSGTLGADLINSKGEIIKTFNGEKVQIEIPSNTCLMLKFK